MNVAVTIPGGGEFGPKMQALNERQRLYVIALLNNGGDDRKACRDAGYGPSEGGIAAQSYRLAHDARVLEAVREEADRRMRSGAILGASVLLEIASDPLHKDRLKAATELLNRSGLHSVSEHKMTVEHTMNDREMVERIKNLAQGLGLDARQLLGAAGVKQELLPPPIDAEFEVVEADTTGLEDIL